jgi:hypothetical protein
LDAPPAPKGSAEDVSTFRKERNAALEASFLSSSNSPDQVALVCDASVPKLLLQAVAAWHAWRFGGEPIKEWHAGGLGTSDDVELLAISQAVIGISEILPQLGEVHIYSDSVKALKWVFDVSSHSSQDCSLAALWTIRPWLEKSPDTRVFLHHVNKDVGMDAHSLVHLFATSVRVEAGGAPVRTADSARAAATSAMLGDWALMLRDPKYIGRNFLRLRAGAEAVAPSHIGGGPWMKGVQRSHRLTARLVRAVTGHAPIGEYSERFFRESSRCMCSHPWESVVHIIHLCPLYTRNPSPGKRYQLVEFVKFLKKNPRAFEWPGANLEQSEGVGGTLDDAGGPTGAPAPPSRQAKSPVGSAGGAPPVGTFPPPPRLAGAISVVRRIPGAHANILQYRRVSKPRARRVDPNQSDIRQFFFLQ